MKKLFLAVSLLCLSTGLFSCSDEKVTETDSLYNIQVNDEDGRIGNDPDEPDDPDGN